MYRHNLHWVISDVCLIHHVAAHSETSDAVLTLLQPLGHVVRPAMQEQTRRSAERVLWMRGQPCEVTPHIAPRMFV